MPRRLMALFSVLGILLFWGGAVAQEQGARVTVNLVTCALPGSAASSVIAPTANPLGVEADCIDGWPESGDGYVTIDGNQPDEVTDTSLTWNGLATGEHVAVTGVGGETSYTFIATGEPVTLFATFYDPVPGPQGSNFTIYLMTCTVDGSAASSEIATHANPQDVGRDCTEGWPDDADGMITIDGIGPDQVTDTSLTWNWLEAGDHLAQSEAGGISTYAFTVDGKTDAIWATFYQNEISNPGDSGGVNPTEVSADKDSGTDTGSTVTGLPSTGVGGSSASTSLGLLVACIAVAGTGLTGLVRRNS